MSTTTIAGNPTEAYARILEQGYGPDSWHGPSLAAALADVTAEMAFRRPAEGRHNIAEIALHHAYTAHALRGRLSGATPEPFVLDGEDWFTVEDGKTLSWAQVRATLDDEQARLADLASAIAKGTVKSPVPEAERFTLVLGITCHAVYHAGQVQLVKRLLGS